jgi:hypothetical protein
MTPLSTPCLNAGFVELIFIPSLIFNLVLHPHCLLISIVDQDTKQGFFVQGTCLPRGSVMVMFPGMPVCHSKHVSPKGVWPTRRPRPGIIDAGANQWAMHGLQKRKQNSRFATQVRYLFEQC